jgi:CSLREA domain-containing protein
MPASRPRMFAWMFAGTMVALTLFAAPARSDSVINVDTATDEALGDSNNGNCTLREAVDAANNDNTHDGCTGSGDDTINLVAGNVYSLTQGDLEITDTLTINGNQTPLQNVFVSQGAADDRVFTVSGISIGVNFNDFGITQANCNPTSCNGAGILVGALAAVNLDGMTVTSNNAGATGLGGGIFNSGIANLTDTSIGDGFSGNTAHGGGGGIYNNDGILTLTRTTVAGNTGVGKGGGIFVNAGTVTLANSTISGNTAGESGGGIYTAGTNPTVTSFYSTISANRADYFSSGSPAGQGGGIAQTTGTVTLTGTILAANLDESSNAPNDAPDCSGTIASQDQNLIGTDENCTLSTQSGDLVGHVGTEVDPLLESLTNNGGPTRTHLPGPTSSAVDNGHGTNCPGPNASNLTTDQRGLARPQNSTCEVGAVERDISPPTIPTLTKPNIRWQPDRSVEMEWTAATDPGGVGMVTYDFGERIAKFDEPALVNGSILGGVFGTQKNEPVSAGRTSCLTVMSRDGDGNQSAPSNEKCTAVPVNDRTLERKGNWTNETGIAYFLNTYVKTQQEGARLLLKDIDGVKRMALVATKCPGCGTVKVFMAGDLVDRVSLQSTTVRHNLAIPLGTFTPKEDGTAKIKVVSSGKPVKIEGLGISKV